MASAAITPTIAVVQVSDFHFRDEEHPVLGRAALIVSALQSLMQPLSTVYVALTGDIAFSGTAAEYTLAEQFVRNLVERFAQVLPGVQVNILMVPGNHDCDLTKDPDIREYSLLENKLPHLEPDGAIVSQSLTVQDEFFTFAAGFGQSHSTPRDKLSKRIEVRAADTFRIGFNLYNTAWLSKNPEEPGKLFVIDAAFIAPDLPADVEIALLHHPLHWLEPNNMLAFRKHLAQTADLLLVGHQHQLAIYRFQDDQDASFDAVEGLAMHDPKASVNGFHLILFALAEERWKKCSFVWGGSSYVPNGNHDTWQSFRRNKELVDQGFVNTPEFKDRLVDPGVAFTHGGTKRVLLPDIFVYPELRQRDLQRKIEATKPSSTLVRSQDVFDWVSTNKQVVIIGEDKAGKTSLAKMLYRDLQRHHNLVPLFVTPEDVDTFKPGELQAFVQSPYQRQYGTKSYNSYLQLPPGRRALIVDDFHNSRLNDVAKANFILHAEPFFEVIVVVIDEAFDLACAVGASGKVPLLAHYRQFRIAEMGHQLRGKLISQWVGLGADAWTNEAETFQKILEKKRSLNPSCAGECFHRIPSWCWASCSPWRCRKTRMQIRVRLESSINVS